MRWQWRQEQSSSAAIRFNSQRQHYHTTSEMNSREDMTTPTTSASSLSSKVQRQQFFLTTATPLGEAQSPYADLYLRHHGSGINSVVLTASPPRFIKAHTSPNADDGEEGKASNDGRISFTSSSHPERQWGLVLCRDGGKLAGWERVEIVEDGGSEGFTFSQREGEDDKIEVLESSMTDEGGETVWKGWIMCEWSTGHPQLFWVTHKLKDGTLPGFCERVDVVREMCR